jgi:carboxymethylenebutenolidase
MGNFIELVAEDGHALDAYQATPSGTPKGGLIVLQEIFGVNAHIQSVADHYAAHGYTVLAPALFDRIERKIDLGYGQEDFAKAFSLRQSLDMRKAILDIQSAVQQLQAQGIGKVCVVGYCFGGTLAWMAAAHVRDVAAVSAYYAGGIGHFAQEKARCPVQFHFGERDKHIPLSEVDAIRRAEPAPEIHLYPADHGFNCDQRESYDADSAKLAKQRTLDLFSRAMG